MNIETQGDAGAKVQYRGYWALSALTTIIVLIFIYIMSMVPGVPSVQKLWMLSIAGALSALSIGVGTWKFRTIEAPILDWPFGILMGVLLFLELSVCIFGVFQVSQAPPIH